MTSRMTLTLLLALVPGAPELPGASHRITRPVEGSWVFQGLPRQEGWGDPLVVPGGEATGRRTLGGLGGLPFVDVYGPEGGVALFLVARHQEPFEVAIRSRSGVLEVHAWGSDRIERFEHSGDFFVALREYALRMKALGIVVGPAPEWAFEPHWETYGFEEDWDADDIRKLLPVMRELGIGSITLDSGWYGEGRGEDWSSATGDFLPNEDVVGSEAELRTLIGELVDAGFRVRLWWCPGVGEEDSDLFEEHPDWFLGEVDSSTGDTADRHLDPRRPEVRRWNRQLVGRLTDLGIHGFKQDDVYHINRSDAASQRAYVELFREIIEVARERDPEVAINTCNCGVAPNIFQFPGENMLITSDPVGSLQFRVRAKMLHALNVGGAAILSDHVELTRGEIDPEDLEDPGFYESVDFASVVPLGLVLQTRFRQDPGDHYRRWFTLARGLDLPRGEYLGALYRHGLDVPEAHAIRKGDRVFHTFYASGHFSGKVELRGLEDPGPWEVRDLLTDRLLGSHRGPAPWIPVDFIGALVLVASQNVKDRD